MRNKFPGTCYVCHKTVSAGAGHFERLDRNKRDKYGIVGKWRVQCASHPIDKRNGNLAPSTAK